MRIWVLSLVPQKKKRKKKNQIMGCEVGLLIVNITVMVSGASLGCTVLDRMNGSPYSSLGLLSLGYSVEMMMMVMIPPPPPLQACM